MNFSALDPSIALVSSFVFGEIFKTLYTSSALLTEQEKSWSATLPHGQYHGRFEIGQQVYSLTKVASPLSTYFSLDSISIQCKLVSFCIYLQLSTSYHDLLLLLTNNHLQEDKQFSKKISVVNMCPLFIFFYTYSILLICVVYLFNSRVFIATLRRNSTIGYRRFVKLV